MESVGWWALSFASEGVLLNGTTLQLGFKSEFRGHSARMGIYYGNQTANPMSAITAVVQLPPSAQGSLALSVQPGPTALPRWSWVGSPASASFTAAQPMRTASGMASARDEGARERPASREPATHTHAATSWGNQIFLFLVEIFLER